MDKRAAKLLLTTDAQVWAKEFMEVVEEKQLENGEYGLPLVVDESMMIAWFANAIETGRSAGRRALEEASEERSAIAAMEARDLSGWSDD